MQAISASIGISQTLRPMADLVLQNKSREIEAAIRPGGSGDPYASLNTVQREILREIIQLGLPIATLEDFYYAVDRTMLAQLQQTFADVDPTYVDDFWSESGYLGLEKSALGDLFRSELSDFNGTVVDVERDDEGVPTAVVFTNVSNLAAFELE